MQDRRSVERFFNGTISIVLSNSVYVISAPL
jgi:hypothetical protein